jgi:hypothetical protein
MGMQKNAWITCHLFEKWLSHFVDQLERRRSISPSNQYILILEMIEKAWTLRIDMISLPSHTSHSVK